MLFKFALSIHELTCCDKHYLHDCKVVKTATGCCYPIPASFVINLYSARGWLDTGSVYTDRNCRKNGKCIDAVGILYMFLETLQNFRLIAVTSAIMVRGLMRFLNPAVITGNRYQAKFALLQGNFDVNRFYGRFC
jgi:hypothetical protein